MFARETSAASSSRFGVAVFERDIPGGEMDREIEWRNAARFVLTVDVREIDVVADPAFVVDDLGSASPSSLRRFGGRKSMPKRSVRVDITFTLCRRACQKSVFQRYKGEPLDY